MIEENVIKRYGLTLLERIDEVNSLKSFASWNSKNCIVVRLNSFSFTDTELIINSVQSVTNILTDFSTTSDGIIKNEVLNSSKSLLLIHLDTMYAQTIGSRGYLDSDVFVCSGFKIYNSDTIKLLPAYEFLKGNFSGSPFDEDTNFGFQLKSSQRATLYGVGLDAWIVPETTNLEIFKINEKLTSVGSSGIKSGQFIL